LILLNIADLVVQIDQKTVIDHLNLEIKSGDLVVLMGPNGSGKSSLALALMGHPDYELVFGKIIFNGQDITIMLQHERAKLGLFLAFQNPRAIPGLSVFDFLKTIYENYTGNLISVPELESLIYQNLELVGLNKNFINRDVNTGFSGGESKRFEILQLLLLKPKLAIIDEIDSGLDLDALKQIAQALNVCHQAGMTILLITHYRRILNYLQPKKIEIVQAGKINKTGGLELIEMIENNGYEKLI